jgi:hypothetical protein
MEVEGETETPGAVVIRPTRADAERNPDDFYALLAALRSPETLPLRKIAEIAGDTSLNPEPNILRKIKNRTLTEDARRFLLRHIFDEENLLSGKGRRQLAIIDDAPYFAFLNYLNVRETSQDTARAHVVGTYKVWRYSIDHADEFILGKEVIFEDPKTRALKVDVTLAEHAVEGMRWMRRLSGYLFCVSGMYMTIVRDTLTDDVRCALLPHFNTGEIGTVLNPRSVFAGRQHHIIAMDGFWFGTAGRNACYSPVHLSLVDDAGELARLNEQLGVIGEDDERIPRRVVKKLKQAGPLRRL